MNVCWKCKMLMKQCAFRLIGKAILYAVNRYRNLIQKKQQFAKFSVCLRWSTPVFNQSCCSASTWIGLLFLAPLRGVFILFPSQKKTVALTERIIWHSSIIVFVCALATRSILFIDMDGDAVRVRVFELHPYLRWHMAYCRHLKQMLQNILDDVKHNKISCFSQNTAFEQTVNCPIF